MSLKGLLAGLTLFGLWTAMASAAEPDASSLTAARQRAISFLTLSQNPDGSWTSPQSPGVSGLVIVGLLKGGAPADSAVVQTGLAHLKTFLQPDGGLYAPNGPHANYETAISLLAFHGANTNGRYNELISRADKFLRGLQWDETEQTDPSDVKYGGAGYGKTGDRPDLSNTLFFLEAIQAAGAKADDPAVQKALVFLSRCQNLETEHNLTQFAAKVNDGGFYYTPAAGGNSQAGSNPDGGLRSYGSMTYAGLKSMIYAGVSKDDPRVKAALAWIQSHYTVTENPGMGQQGVLYYHHMFAKALATLELNEVTDASGATHQWRKELADHLLAAQQPNGSWVNTTPRWYEGDPNLATAYVLMALAYIDGK